MTLKGTLKRLHFRLRQRRSVAVIRRSTSIAERLIPSTGIGILVDSNIHSYAVTHETAWISTGQKPFGPTIRNTGYAARVPIYKRGSKSPDYEEVCYLASIARLAQLDRVKLWTSHHLILERAPHPRERFTDTGWYDLNLFGRGEMDSIDGDPYDEIITAPFSPNQPSLVDISAELSASNDPLYLSLLKVMGQKNSQDAWHIRTAEIHGLYCFLTMDRKLLNVMKAQKSRPVIAGLKTKILSPAMAGKALGIKPIELYHLDFQSASYPVRDDLHWDGEKRPRKGSKRHK